MQKVLLGKALDLEAEAPGLCVFKRQSVFHLFKDFHCRENRHILPYRRPHCILAHHELLDSGQVMFLLRASISQL